MKKLFNLSWRTGALKSENGRQVQESREHFISANKALFCQISSFVDGDERWRRVLSITSHVPSPIQHFSFSSGALPLPTPPLSFLLFPFYFLCPLFIQEKPETASILHPRDFFLSPNAKLKPYIVMLFLLFIIIYNGSFFFCQWFSLCVDARFVMEFPRDNNNNADNRNLKLWFFFLHILQLTTLPCTQIDIVNHSHRKDLWESN